MYKLLLRAVILMVVLVRPARADLSEASTEAARIEARKLLDSGVDALTGSPPDFRAAQRDMERAYRLYPKPLMFYNLGKLWSQQRRPVEAADLLRRYLQESGAEVSSERRAQAERLISAGRGPAGELALSAEAGAFVYIDDLLAGITPLSMPLLLKAGPHRLRLEKGYRQIEFEATIKRGEQGQRELKLPQAVALLTEGGLAGLEQALKGDFEQRGLVIIPRSAQEALLRASPDLRACLARETCQVRLGEALGAQQVLRVSVALGLVAAQLLDVAVGQAAATGEQPCADCGGEQSVPKATQVVLDVVRRGLERPRGLLEVSTAPAGQVHVDDREWGVAPLRRPVFAGSHKVEVVLPGYVPYRTRVDVEDGQSAVLRDVKLQAVKSTVTLRAMRPRWRIITGVVTIAVGLGLAGFGAYELAVNGSCTTSPCARTITAGMVPTEMVVDGLGVGVGSIVGGAVLIAGGAVLTALPAKSEVVQVSVGGIGTGYGLRLAGAF